MSETDVGTASPAFFGFMGSSLALILANAGAAYGTAKAGIGISAMGVMNPDAVMRNLLPVIMAGIIGIYGLILAVILSNNVTPPNAAGASSYTFQQGFKHMASGLAVGLGGVGAGYAIGLVGDIGVKAVGLQPKLFVPLILILIMAEAIALYGLIVALVLSS